MSRPSFFRDSYRLLISIGVISACLLLLSYPATLLFQRLRDSRAAYARELAAAVRVESLGARVNWDGETVRCVSVNRGKFSDDMADALSGLSDLKAIDLWVDVPSDRAIAKLKKVKRLRGIELSGPGVRDTTIACLKDVKGLERFSVGHAAITDGGLGHLAAFARLEYLKISRGAITDAGVRHLGSLRNLKGLDLRNIAVTDAGLAELRTLTNLKTLRLYECKQITARGVQALQQALPNTSIGWDKCAIAGDLY